MLESLDKLNIGSLNIEEPQRRSEFPGDVRDWFRPEDLPESEQVDGWELVNDAERAKLILFPDIFPVQLLAKERIKRANREGLQSNINNRDVFLYCFDIIANTNFLYPGEEFFSDLDWESIINHLRTKRAASFTPLTYFESAASVSRIDPKRVKQFNLDSDDIWQEGLDLLNKEREDNSWFIFLRLAANMKTLNSEKFKEFEITSEDWRKIKEAFQYQLTKSDDLIANAGDILTLQAEEIRLTPEGVEVIMPYPKTPLVEFIPSLPETRKF
ncbi:MAG: hypothetical protein Q7R49_01780 [Candidatus Daviesbacteria bacterium]|nr:hypothetical protein [Candidatus Daviesbacteria bacterium]